MSNGRVGTYGPLLLLFGILCAIYACQNIDVDQDEPASVEEIVDAALDACDAMYDRRHSDDGDGDIDARLGEAENVLEEAEGPDTSAIYRYLVNDAQQREALAQTGDLGAVDARYGHSLLARAEEACANLGRPQLANERGDE